MPWLKKPSSASHVSSAALICTGLPASRATSAAVTVATSGTPASGGWATSDAGALPTSVAAGTRGTTTSMPYSSPSCTPPVSTAPPVASL